MFDCIYHMTKHTMNHFLREQFAKEMWRCYWRHFITLLKSLNHLCFISFLMNDVISLKDATSYDIS